MDPHTNTREQFTNGFIFNVVPDDANPDWRKHVERHKLLFDELAHHPSMAPNL